MSAYSDLHDERFARSLWWKALDPEPTDWAMRAILTTAHKDDPLTIARRRKELIDELADDVAEEIA